MRDGLGSGGSLGNLLLRVLNPLWVLPAVIITGLFLTESAPDGIESFYMGTALPFLITCWIGAGFTSTWRRVRESMRLEGAPQGVIAATGVLSALVLLSMLGGVRLLWEDPWLFGVAVWPGFSMAGPALQRWLQGRSTRPAPDGQAKPQPPDASS